MQAAGKLPIELGDAAGGEGLLAGVDVSQEMHFDGAGEVEAAFDGSMDKGGLLDVDHGSAREECKFDYVQIVRFGEAWRKSF